MRPDIEGIKADFERARQEVYALCEGSRRWTMSIPVRDVDSDRVIIGALAHEQALLAYIEELEAGAMPKVAAFWSGERWLTRYEDGRWVPFGEPTEEVTG